ncbi:MAG: ABC transporter substrate-binding protein [Candidatus Eremiobacterota bacterium]
MKILQFVSPFIKVTCIIFIFLTLLFIPSCKNPEAFDKKDTIFLPLYRKNISLNPLQAYDSESAKVIKFLFEPLLDVNEKGEIIPNIIQQWNYSPDGLIWTFKVNRDVMWSDGEYLKTDDIIATLNYLRDPEKSPFFSEKLRPVNKFQRDDEYSFSVFLNEPYSPFPVILNSVYPVPEGSILKNSKTPSGCGPYILKNSSDKTIYLSRNVHYRKNPGHIKNICFRIYEQEESALSDFLSDRIDLLDNMSVEQYTEIKDRDFVCFNYPEQSFTVMGFNFKSEIFRDRRIREAISYSIDRDIIVRYLLRRMGHISTGPVNPFMSDWYNRDVKTYPFNLKKAETLLKEAGWYKGESGFLEKNGKIFYFKLATNRGDRLRERVVTVIQQNLLQTGIAVDTVFMEKNEFLEKICTGSLDSWCIDFTGEAIDPDSMFYYFHSSAGPELGNYGSYSNKEMDKLLFLGRRESDREKRKKIYYKLQSLVAEDLPAVYLCSRDRLVASSRRIEIPEETDGRYFNFYRDFCKWKIKE